MLPARSAQTPGLNKGGQTIFPNRKTDTKILNMRLSFRLTKKTPWGIGE
jgi:hypothetical protein